MDEMQRRLKNVHNDYRALPFWSWNDKLDKTLLKEQIQEMKKAGLGGYFMHARGGLETPYMGKEWFEAVQACTKEGTKLGMDSWSYDENGWPSGFADGRVCEKGEKYQVKYLSRVQCRAGEAEPVHALCIYTEQGGECIVHPAPPENEEYFAVVRVVNPYYVDNLDASVVADFIRETHEVYKEKCRCAGGRMPGFFTDEPQHGGRCGTPYSDTIPQAFLDKWGYDVMPKLPMLFGAYKGYKKFRYEYYQLISELFVQNFFQQIYDWCEENGMQLTGHVMAEDDLISQVAYTGGVMPCYEYMHIPGIDYLGRGIGDCVLPRQVGSVAMQLGKKRVLSEMYALCGWNVSFEELKWIAQWQYVNGVTLMCQHLEGYTLRGLRKRDYPPSLFIQQPWWDEYRAFNDYFARLGQILGEGESEVDALLIHPIKSAYIYYAYDRPPKAVEFNAEFQRQCLQLEQQHIEFHFGDETILLRHGRVENGKLQVGRCRYQNVLLPSMVTIDKSTLDLLLDFAKAGGGIYAMGELPTLCEGQEADLSALAAVVSAFADVPDERCTDLSPISIIDRQTGQKATEIRYTRRRYAQKQVYYLTNQSLNMPFQVCVKIEGDKTYCLLALEDLSYHQIPCQDGYLLDFAPMQSYLLVEGEGEVKEADLPILALQKDWEMILHDPNAITLDMCKYRINGGAWQEKKAVILLMQELLERQENCRVEQLFTFFVQEVPQGEVFVAIEKPQDFEITIDDKRIDNTPQGYFRDSEFKKINITGNIKKGENKLVLKGNFYQRQKVYDVLFGENVLETEKNKLTLDSEFESIYILGDFGVFPTSVVKTQPERMIDWKGNLGCERYKSVTFTGGDFVLASTPKIVQIGDLTLQGLCFYSGAVTLRQGFYAEKSGKMKVVLSAHPKAAMLVIRVNEKKAATLMWAPFEAVIEVKQGENILDIVLYSSNRNLLGPHHFVLGESYRVGPSTFSAQQGWCEGAISGNIWNDDYCFVEFGL